MINWQKIQVYDLEFGIGTVKQNVSLVKLQLLSYPAIVTYVLGAEKNRLIEIFLVPTTYVLVKKFEKLFSSTHIYLGA